MTPFEFARPRTIADAIKLKAANPQSKFIAGGTNLVDLMKMYVEQPTQLIDVSALPLREVEDTSGGGLRVGALVRNADLAYHPLVESRYPILSSAILAGASQQLRNMATVGGNLLQRTRCAYFYDVVTACNKRRPGAGCAALEGHNRMNAILGASTSCIAVHPSDMCVALAVLEARVHVMGVHGARIITLADFHRLPGSAPQRETIMAPDEIITHVELPPQGFAAHYTYLKIRDRLSYAFALVSVAVGMERDGDTIRTARFALGGVAHKPWRNAAAEVALQGQPATDATFAQAADIVLSEATGYEHNAFKIGLARRAIVRALSQAASGAPQSQSSKKIA
jgi:xanthine dehydrogenase YagS FAD-binding subunit